MKIGYKATNKDIRCRTTQYEIGKKYIVDKLDSKIYETASDYTPVENNNLNLCTSQVIHYCNDIVSCFNFYKRAESRVFEVSIEGEYKDEHDKSGTTILKFLREITEEEIEKAFEDQKQEKLIKNLKLKQVKALQDKYPYLILGGSLALYLQGAKLERLEYGVGDLDFIHPFYINMTDEEVHYIDEKNSGNDFDQTYVYDGIKIDLCIDNTCKYSVVEFAGEKYKVNTIENILKYKIKYSEMKGGEKHRDDIRELLGINKNDTAV